MYAYAESKKESKKGWHYQLYMKKQVGKSHQFASIGDLILLEIHDVLKKALNTARPPVLYHLGDLLTCQLIKLVIYIIIPAEENVSTGNPPM